MEIDFFMLRFWVCTQWIIFQNTGAFFVFLKFNTFQDITNLIFEGSTFLNQFQNSNVRIPMSEFQFQSLIFWCQKISPKLQSYKKLLKPYSHQSRGHMGDFKND